MSTIEVLMSPGCGHGRQTVELVATVLADLGSDARIEVVTVETMEDAARLGFRGSPTVLVDGKDIDLAPPGDVALG